MVMCRSYGELVAMSDEDLIAEFDEMAQRSGVGVNFLREEIARRVAERHTQRITDMTRSMRNLTALVTFLTLANVILVAVSLFFSS